MEPILTNPTQGTKVTAATKIAILCWELGQVPKGLMQLESLVGNSTNLASYDYPVQLHRVAGANVHTILENPSQIVLNTMIKDAQQLASEGIKAITTSCGFNAIFQAQLAQQAGIPVFTSSLLQVPLARQIIGPDAEIAIVTAQSNALSNDHLLTVGITDLSKLHIVGLEKCSEWNKIFDGRDLAINLEVVKQEILSTIEQTLKDRPQIKAIVLECTDLPPYSEAIRKLSQLPVFDFITMMNYLHAVI